MSNAKNIRLNMALVDKSFKALAPNIPVISNPKATYIIMIPIP